MRRNVSQRDGRGRRGRERSAGDFADGVAGRVQNLHVRACCGASFELQAHAEARRAFRQFAQHPRRAGEAALGPSPLADGEGQPRLDGRDGFVDVLAIKRKPGFEPQRIAGAKADGQHARFREEAPGKRFGRDGADGDFEAILAGIAGAGDIDLLAQEGKARAVHEGKAARAGDEPVKQCGGLRALQRDQRAPGCRFELDVTGKPRRDVCVIDFLAPGVDDEGQALVIAVACHHQIVDDPTVLVQDLRIAEPPRLQPEDVAGHQRLQRRGRCLEIRPLKPRLPHMRHVEQARGAAHMGVLLDDARRILERHLVTREGHKLRAKLAVERVERRQAHGPGRAGGDIIVLGYKLAHWRSVT